MIKYKKERRQNMKNKLKKEIENKLKKIINIGINIDSLLEESKTLFESTSTIESLNIYLAKLQKYDCFINLYDQLENIKTKESFDDYRSSIIYILEELKNKDEFIDDNYSKYINKIYDLAYTYMLYEFIYTSENKLFNYFNNNYHDFWYINEFLKRDIEKIKYSINYIEGQEELLKIIKTKNLSHYMAKEIIINLCICLHRNEFLKEINQKLENTIKNFMQFIISYILNSVHMET